MTSFNYSLLIGFLSTLILGALYFTESRNQSFLTSNIEVQAGFTNNFQDFLNQNGYGAFDFQRKEILDSCFGGALTTPINKPAKIPVVFIHGNSDIGFGTNGWQTGARKLFEHLMIYDGYEKKDLYTFTWGSGDANYAALNYHSKNYLTTVRAFIEAVLKYTKADKVNLVGHSMGVTLARKAIKGGLGNDDLAGGSYNLGPSLTTNVNVFIGIAGANEGLVDCYATPEIPTCGYTNGFYPGTLAGFMSKFLQDLNDNSAREGNWVVSVWSKLDNVIKYGCLVYGKYTPRIKGQNQELVYSNYSHFEVRDQTADDILQIFRQRG